MDALFDKYMSQLDSLHEDLIKKIESVAKGE